MGYRDLTPQAMVNISAPWLDPEKDRQALTALPLLVGLLPILEEAHVGLETTQRLSSAIEQRLRALLDRAVVLDDRHDTKLRGSFNFLGAVAELTDDPEMKMAVLDLRDRLVPAGLKATMRSYSEQAGDARLLPSRLDDASRKLLQEMHTPTGPLSDHVDAWVAAAIELDEVDQERVRLAKSVQSGADSVTPLDVLNAKRAWVRAANALESNLALEKELTEELHERLLGRLHREEAKASRRADARRKAAPAHDEPEAPCAPPDDKDPPVTR